MLSPEHAWPWWAITTERERYIVQAETERDAEDYVACELAPDETVLDGMNLGPYSTESEAEEA